MSSSCGRHIATTLPPHRRHIAATSPPHRPHIAATSPPHCRHIAATSPPHCRHIAATSPPQLPQDLISANKVLFGQNKTLLAEIRSRGSCGGEVAAMWRQRGGNVAAMRRRCGGNVAAMRRRCGGDVAAMWRQCGGNVAAMRRRCGGDVAARWRRCGGDVAAMWRRCVGDVMVMWWQCGGDVMAMWWQCGDNAVSLCWQSRDNLVRKTMIACPHIPGGSNGVLWTTFSTNEAVLQKRSRLNPTASFGFARQITWCHIFHGAVVDVMYIHLQRLWIKLQDAAHGCPAIHYDVKSFKSNSFDWLPKAKNKMYVNTF